MSSESRVTVTYSRDKKAAHLILNRPEKVNAVDFQTADELRDAVREIERNGTTRVITIRGAGDNFCSGVDIEGIYEYVRESRMDDLRDAEERIESCFEALADCRLPIVALVEGYALAGGLELVLLSDLSIATTDAQLGDQHTNVNLIPGGGSTQRLPRRIGSQRAKELIFTGKRISGTEASEWGLVTEAVDEGDLESRADELVDAIADKGRRTVQKAKYLVDQGETTDLDTGLELEKYVSTMHFFSEEGKEGLRSFSEDE
jgi:enoyl-CoA hydratase/carnithine racemase